MRIRIMVLLMIFIATGSEARGLAGAVARAAAERAAERASGKVARSSESVMARDLRRDAATTAKPTESRTVQRFTTHDRATHELESGVPAGAHMTSGVPRGRGVTAERARTRYGLPATPDTVMTIRIPAGTPVKKNKALGGEPGRGEITATETIPPQQILKVRELKHRTDKPESH